MYGLKEALHVLYKLVFVPCLSAVFIVCGCGGYVGVGSMWVCVCGVCGCGSVGVCGCVNSVDCWHAEIEKSWSVACLHIIDVSCTSCSVTK